MPYITTLLFFLLILLAYISPAYLLTYHVITLPLTVTRSPKSGAGFPASQLLCHFQVLTLVSRASAIA